MGKVNVGAMKKDRAKKKAESRRGGDWLSMKNPGELMIYVAGVTRDEDELPYLETFIHYNLGPENRAAACLDLDVNEVLTDDRVHAYLPDGSETVDGDCTACEAAEVLWAEYRRLKEKKVTKKKLDEAYRNASSVTRNRKFVFNVCVMASRDTAEDEWEWVDKGELKLQPYGPGTMVWEQILDAFIQEGDITDPDEAIFLRLVKTGKVWHEIKYKCTPYIGTARKPFGPQKLSKALKRQIEDKLHAEGDLDLYRHVCDNVRTRADMEKLLSGIDVEEEDEDSDGKPTCYKMDYSDDKECMACRWRGPCAGACEVELFPGHELKEGDEDYEEEEEEDPKKAKAAKAKAAKAKEEKEKAEADEKKKADAKAKKDAKKKADAKAKKDAKKKEEEEESETGSNGDDDEEEVDVYEELEKLGYDDGQVERMAEETEDFLVDNEIPATATSILPDGKYKLFPQKLPEDHALYEAPPKEEKPKKRRRRKKKAEEAAPPKEEEPSPEPEPPAEESGGDDMGLDDLERELRESANKGKRKRKKK